MCFTKRCWRLSCSPRHLTAFHLLLLLDQPRAAVTSPFPVLTSHAHARPSHTHTARRPLAHELYARMFWLVSWSLFRQAGWGERASRTTFHLKSQCEYANWTLDGYERCIKMSVCYWGIHRRYYVAFFRFYLMHQVSHPPHHRD